RGERTRLADVQRHRGFDPTEGEVRRAIAHARGGKPDGGGVATLGCQLDGGAARIAQGEKLGDLVEGFARGVVSSLAHPRIAPRRLDYIERGVAARHYEGEEGMLGRALVEEGGVDVALEMIHADEGSTVGPAQRLGGGATHEERAHETRPLGH